MNDCYMHLILGPCYLGNDTHLWFSDVLFHLINRVIRLEFEDCNEWKSSTVVDDL
jgi:hypothetical protein